MNYEFADNHSYELLPSTKQVETRHALSACDVRT